MIRQEDEHGGPGASIPEAAANAAGMLAALSPRP